MHASLIGHSGLGRAGALMSDVADEYAARIWRDASACGGGVRQDWSSVRHFLVDGRFGGWGVVACHYGEGHRTTFQTDARD
jgi:hypothetical protein